MSFLRSIAKVCIALLLGGLLLLATVYLSAWMLRPTPEMPDSEDEAAAKRALRMEMDVVREAQLAEPGEGAVIWQDVDYSEGPEGAWFPRGESPILRDLVEAGSLPPVQERVGPEPLVMRGVDGLGNYGGTWHRIANTAGDVALIQWRMSGASLVRWSPEGYPIVPHLLKGWESSDDYRVWTLHLRRGVRWSDGHPFTVDDIEYFYVEEVERMSSPVAIGMATSGVPGRFERVDDYTFRLHFEHPFGAFLQEFSKVTEFYSPRHYLQQFHPEIGDPDRIAAEMERHGIHSRHVLYGRLKSWLNPEHPRMWPWIYRSFRSSPPQVFVRNPYFWAVDPEGNQLPYIDELVFREIQQQLIPASATRGHASMQNRHLRFADYTLLMAERERGNYRVHHWYPGTRSIWAINPNLNRLVSEREPDSANKAALLRKLDFRRALSLAINREAIIRALYSGVGEPSQISPGPESPHHHPASSEAYIAYDPERANELLDAMGLTRRDREGYRTFADGSRMTWFLNYSEFTGPGPVEFVKDDWAAVGIRAIPRERSRSLFTSEWLGLRQDFTIWTSEGDFNPLLSPRSFVPTNLDSMFATGYGRWFNHGGLFGEPRRTSDAILEPSANHPLRRAMEIYVDALASGTLAEQVQAFRPALDLAAENLWTISIATAPPELVVVDNNMRNVPERGIVAATLLTPANMGFETFFFEQSHTSQSARERLQRQILEIVPMQAAIGGDSGAVTGQRLGALVRNLIWLSLFAALVAVGVRHPFIGRRLLIMIPTLLIVSIVTFVIIQLPPSDFLEVRITELELQGDEAARAQIEELRESFYLDRPMLERYLRWLGVYWFFSFDSVDRGLMQGDMGRSMETNTSVNSLVGDRILLTVLVSIGTILFTWAIALPIGIYSAVRQYSLGDYVTTILGFLGMCIPNFLLALILIYLAKEWFGIDAIGLFSPEFATQEHWDWPKVWDLMEHIWLPILVLGVGGTAGMIRVMRGNLLDELRKPYVTTARAKGVRPLKLLLKYPVRLALNPFISGIGGIFPQIVSGGAIVAIVLSLPMVGPLMLTAMMSQDTYLAGSMLMVLSLLGIMGTLVSDLLLLWLDPRIRMEGGKR